MDQVEWLKIVNKITDEMRAHTRAFVSPISTSNDKNVRLTGSGTFVRAHGKRILLSCEHVTRNRPVEFQLFGCETVFRMPHVDEERYPTDLAFGLVPDEVWCESERVRSVPYSWFADHHAPSDPAEPMFVRGYAGENSTYGFGILESNGTGYCTQVKPIHAVDRRRFEVHWVPDQMQYTTGTDEESRKAVEPIIPRGLSGSLVWNTRYVEVSRAGVKWTPDHAVITGLADRWDPDAKTLLVHRVELVRSWLDAKLNRPICSRLQRWLSSGN